jgi:hypothetical protein
VLGIDVLFSVAYLDDFFSKSGSDFSKLPELDPE